MIAVDESKIIFISMTFATIINEKLEDIRFAKIKKIYYVFFPTRLRYEDVSAKFLRSKHKTFSRIFCFTPVIFLHKCCEYFSSRKYKKICWQNVVLKHEAIVFMTKQGKMFWNLKNGFTKSRFVHFSVDFSRREDVVHSTRLWVGAISAVFLGMSITETTYLPLPCW